MNDLRRELAPVTDRAWKEIEGEAENVLRSHLAGRKVVDLQEPLGWEASSVGTGRTTALETAPAEGVELRMREVQPLIELRVPFRMNREELETIDRGAKDCDLGPVAEAARRLARSEDRLVFHGGSGTRLTGICARRPEDSVKFRQDYESFPDVLAEALELLKMSDVEGPYGLVLGPAPYQGLSRARSGGYPVINHVRRLIDGPTVWSAALEGAVLLSLRGGDFELVLGRDISIGYRNHSAEEVELYFEESLTFRPLRPEAAVPILPFSG